MASADVLENGNGSNGNSSKEAWSGIAAPGETPSGDRRIEVMITKGAMSTVMDQLLGTERERPVLDKEGKPRLVMNGDEPALDGQGKPIIKTRYGRELTGVDTLAVVGDFAVVDDETKPESVEAIRRLRESDVTFLGSVAELVPLDPGVEPYKPAPRAPVYHQPQLF